jgi:hypothetical protein
LAFFAAGLVFVFGAGFGFGRDLALAFAFGFARCFARAIANHLTKGPEPRLLLGVLEHPGVVLDDLAGNGGCRHRER